MNQYYNKVLLKNTAINIKHIPFYFLKLHIKRVQNIEDAQIEYNAKLNGNHYHEMNSKPFYKII